MKIPVHHYIEVTETMTTPPALNPTDGQVGKWYITNLNGKTYIVEIWD